MFDIGFAELLLIGVVGLGLVMLVSIFVMNVYDVAEH